MNNSFANIWDFLSRVFWLLVIIKIGWCNLLRQCKAIGVWIPTRSPLLKQLNFCSYFQEDYILVGLLFFICNWSIFVFFSIFLDLSIVLYMYRSESSEGLVLKTDWVLKQVERDGELSRTHLSPNVLDLSFEY